MKLQFLLILLHTTHFCTTLANPLRGAEARDVRSQKEKENHTMLLVAPDFDPTRAMIGKTMYQAATH